MVEQRKDGQRRTTWKGLAIIVLALGMGTAQAADDFTTPQPASAPSAQPQGQQQAAPDQTTASHAGSAPNFNAPGTSRLGHEYVALTNPVRAGTPMGIEVIEFFSYGCIACAKADALMQQWSQGLPYFVHFSASPAGDSASWLYAARIYYALDALNVEQRMRQELFKSITQDGLKYGNVQVLNIWLDAHSINAKAFNKAFDSDLVIAKTGSLPQVMRMYEIQGVPAVVIDGRYLVTAASAGGVDKLPGVVGDVVNRVIQERKNAGY